MAVHSRANASDYRPRPPIQISGDGHLDQKASVPGSGEATRFDSLEVYLVSYPGQLNLTVSAGPDLLTREQGSTVKHFDYNVSTCVPAGTYNVRPTTRRPLTATFRLLTSEHGPPYALLLPDDPDRPRTAQLTFYEGLHINDTPFFSITAYP